MIHEIEAAQLFLRSQQARWVTGLATGSPESPREAALAAARERMDPSLRDGDYVRDGAFSYLAGTEEARWVRSREIIDRVGPGPHEDGRYLELLARQAASVELTLLDMAKEGHFGFDLPMSDALQGILLGTTGQLRSEATTSRLRGSSAVVIALSAGMVYLMYQAAKAVVLSWRPKGAPNGAAVSFSTRLEDTRAILEADQEPVHQLAETLLNWMITGIARPADSRAPAPQYVPPLALLINHAERWVIGHEYCHALFDNSPYEPPPWLPTPTTKYQKEFRADLLSTIILIRAGSTLDRMAPNMVLQGATLAMKIHELADRAIDLARGGNGDPAWESTSHPPFSERARTVFSAYEALIGASDEGLQLDPAYFVASTLDELWIKVRPIIESEVRSGARIHPMWEL